MSVEKLNDEQLEQHRAECEARYWLGKVGTSPISVNRLKAKIAKKRGQPAAERLVDDMRSEYCKQKGIEHVRVS